MVGIGNDTLEGIGARLGVYDMGLVAGSGQTGISRPLVRKGGSATGIGRKVDLVTGLLLGRKEWRIDDTDGNGLFLSTNIGAVVVFDPGLEVIHSEL